MPLSRPTLPQLRDRIAADVESRLAGADARLRRSNTAVQAAVEAATAHGLYGYVDFVARQVIIDTAEKEWLERWGSVWGLVRNAALSASGNVVVTGLTGVLVPGGTALQRSDGTQYVTLADVVLASGTGTVAVAAVVGGIDGNTAPGSSLVFTSALPNVNASAVVDGSGLQAGTDVESDDELRARLLYRIRRPPQGGAQSDYENWMLSVPGVTRVWVKQLYSGAGTVGIFFVRDDDADSIFPDTDAVAAAQAYIDSVRPVTAIVTVLAPTPAPVDFTIHISPDTSAVRAAVSAELVDLLLREAEPGGTILLSHIREAVSIAAGENDNAVTVPSGNFVADPGDMPAMGTITWV